MDKSLPLLILASRSPRRQELLRAAGYAFEVIPPAETTEGDVCREEPPAALVARLAYQKAADVARQVRPGGEDHAETGAQVPPRLILGCDTVVECDGRILGKPLDAEDARRMLHALRGREHRVLSGLCLWAIPSGKLLVQAAVTRLRMDGLSDDAIDEYLAGGQWEGKAGAFGYQDRLDWVHVIEGSPSNVVGLPLELLEEMLREFCD